MTTIPAEIPFEDEYYKWDYDDKGVICRFDKHTESWEPMEDHCLTCGRRCEECDCEECEVVKVKGECGRCGEENGKGGSVLWNDLCWRCDEYETYGYVVTNVCEGCRDWNDMSAEDYHAKWSGKKPVCECE